MKGGFVGLCLCIGGLLGCAPPPPPVDLPGTLIGSFAFTGTLLSEGADAGLGMPTTTCDLDGGAVVAAPTLFFYAGLSVGPKPGAVWWELEGATAQPGVALDGGFSVAIQSTAPLSSCGCTAALTETIAGSWPASDGGGGGGPKVPVLSLTGWLDDRLDPEPADTGGCAADAGPSCTVGCDVVYALTAVPGQPGP
ncbi:MAG: hypothetical protein ACYCWW_10765 [Deltaproteobacteria bacterium]